MAERQALASTITQRNKPQKQIKGLQSARAGRSACYMWHAAAEGLSDITGKNVSQSAAHACARRNLCFRYMCSCQLKVESEKNKMKAM